MKNRVALEQKIGACAGADSAGNSYGEGGLSAPQVEGRWPRREEACSGAAGVGLKGLTLNPDRNPALALC